MISYDCSFASTDFHPDRPTPTVTQALTPQLTSSIPPTTPIPMDTDPSRSPSAKSTSSEMGDSKSTVCRHVVAHVWHSCLFCLWMSP